jgi:hypothetical protein
MKRKLILIGCVGMMVSMVRARRAATKSEFVCTHDGSETALACASKIVSVVPPLCSVRSFIQSSDEDERLRGRTPASVLCFASVDIKLPRTVGPQSGSASHS